jgi:hypothetical protein
MTRPDLFIRFTGSPLGALLLFALYVAIGVSWHQGVAPWWLALGAVGAALRTWRSVRHMRTYKRWRAQWQEMGEDDTPKPSKPRSYGWVYVLACLLLVGIPIFLGGHSEAPSAFLSLVWIVTGMFLLVAFVRAVIRRTKYRRDENALSALVTWMVGKPFSSPSRSAAQKALPDYTLRVMGARTDRGGRVIDAVAAR